MTKLAEGRPRAPLAVAWPLAWNSRVSAWDIAIPAALLAVALFLRLFRLEIVAWVPDSYERLEDARRLLGGEMPQSPFYPPGVSVLMAPLMAFLPHTLATMQAVIIAFGAGLVVVAYVGVIRLTGDRLAAALLAGAIGLAPNFVYASRDGLYDAIVAFLVVTAVFTVPLLRGRGVGAFVAYGALLALLVNIRPANGCILPALLVYWLALSDSARQIGRIKAAVATPQVLAAVATLAVLTGASMAGGAWFGNATGTPLTLDRFGENLLRYADFLVGGPLAAILVVPAAVAGAVRLWRSDRALFWAVGLVLLAWPLVYAPFHFSSLRYMLTPLFFVFLLAALGYAQLLRPRRPATRLGGKALWAYGAAAAPLLTAYLALSSAHLLQEWPRLAAESDEGLARQVSPVLAGLESDALVVSAVSRALSARGTEVALFDLIDQSLAVPDRTARTEAAAARIAGAVSEGRGVYYLYTHWEAGDDFQGDGRDGYRLYFEAVAEQFELTEVFRTEYSRRGLNPWVLYKVESR